MEEEMEKEKIQTEYDEINLMDYLKVIIRRKRMISGVFLVVLIVVAVYSFFICPRVYKIATSLEIGAIGGETIEGPAQVVEKIKNDIYGILVREKLNIAERDYPKIKNENPKDTNLITMEIESSQPETGKNILVEINNLILEEHQEKIQNKKALIEKDIERLKSKTASLEEEKKNLEGKIEAIQKILPYQQTPGTQFALFDTKEKLELKKQEIEDLYIQVNSLEGGLENIQPTEIIKPPTISESPIKPRPLLNIVIGAVLGIFLGIFFAFGKEWWKKDLNTVN